ncbi:hypothetical protein ACEQPO_28075 [Bacillus sp. SL00103]
MNFAYRRDFTRDCKGRDIDEENLAVLRPGQKSQRSSSAVHGDFTWGQSCQRHSSPYRISWKDVCSCRSLQMINDVLFVIQQARMGSTRLPKKGDEADRWYGIDRFYR